MKISKKSLFFYVSVFLIIFCFFYWLKNRIFIITVNPYSGLGNQMFAYASNLIYAKNHNKFVCRSDSTEYLSETYKLSIPLCPEYLNLFSYFIREKLCYWKQYSKEQIDNSNCIIIIGYMQNEAYFLGKKKEIEQEFQLKKKLTAKNQEMVQQMEKENSVCLHFRRGDYLETGYPILGLEYYNQGIDYIKDKTQKDVTLYVFSNDMPWVKKNFKRSEKTLYVEDSDAATDMKLMKHCKHNIIANSSYSWWSAYLNKNPDKIVVAPDTWDYRHSWWGDEIILKDWVKLPAHAN